MKNGFSVLRITILTILIFLYGCVSYCPKVFSDRLEIPHHVYHSFTYQTEWEESTSNSDSKAPFESQVIELLHPSSRVSYTKILNKSSEPQQVHLESLEDGHTILAVKGMSEKDGKGGENYFFQRPLFNHRAGDLIRTVAGREPDHLESIQYPEHSHTDESFLLFVNGYYQNGFTFLPKHIKFEPDNRILKHATSLHDNALHVIPPDSDKSLKSGVDISDPMINIKTHQDIHFEKPSDDIKEWTIFIYMNSVSNLHRFAVPNIEQMLRGLISTNVQIVLEWKQAPTLEVDPLTFHGTRRYLLRYAGDDKPKMFLLEDLGSSYDIGSAESLRSFLNWGVKKYPSKRKMFLFWGHGHGWKPGRNVETSRDTLSNTSRFLPITRFFNHDESTGSCIPVWTIPKVFKGYYFDAFIWDASLMQMIEVAAELEPCAEYVVGSQESPPGPGFPYEKIIKNICENASKSTHEVLEHFVVETVDHEPYLMRPVEESVISTKKLSEIYQAIKALSEVFTAYYKDIEDGYIYALNSAKKFKHLYYYDIVDFLKKMKTQELPHQVQIAIGNTIESITSPNVQMLSCSYIKGNTWSCSHEGKHTDHCQSSYGLSIDMTPSNIFRDYYPYYKLLKFHQKTGWGDWLMRTPEVEVVGKKSDDEISSD